MPTSKSSTSNEDYKQLLDRVLAAAHRDGGQYTLIAGYDVSAEEACLQIRELYRKCAALQARIRQLVK
jgi:hypothetical protein